MKLLIISIFLSLLSIMIARPAFAYLDPGSGSFILQIILGMVLGGLFTVKVYWRKLKTFFFSIIRHPDSKNKHDKKG